MARRQTPDPYDRIHVFCRFWPGFTEPFPIINFDRTREDDIVAEMRHVLAREYRSSYRSGILVRASRRSHDARFANELFWTRELRKVGQLLRASTEVGWYDIDAIPDLGLMKQSLSLCSARIWLATVDSSDLSAQLRLRVRELFGLVHGGMQLNALNPHVGAVRASLVDSAEVNQSIAQLESGRHPVLYADLIGKILPDIKAFIDHWLDLYDQRYIPLARQTRLLSKQEAADIHKGASERNPTTYFKRLIESGK
jgi:hypothetical protein